MKKAVVFDLDGTLVNSIYDLAAANNYALKKNGYPTHPDEAYLIFVGNGIKKLIERSLGEYADEDTIKKVKADFDIYYKEHCCDRTVPYEGIEKLISQLKKSGYKLGVCSNKAQAYTEQIVKTLFGDDSFDVIYGQRPDFPLKPEPQALYYVLDCLGASVSESLYIGDSEVDILVGNNAGIDTVGVTWGFRSEQELRDKGAVYIAHTAEDILNILNTEAEI